jgi:hypothetical protein
VFAIIQRQKQPTRPQGVGKRFKQRPPGLLAHADHRGHPRDHLVGLPQVSQLDEPHPVGKLICYSGQHPQRQPGLPDTARPAQRQGTRLTQQVAQLAKLTLTADEAIRFFGQMGLILVHFRAACFSHHTRRTPDKPANL